MTDLAISATTFDESQCIDLIKSVWQRMTDTNVVGQMAWRTPAQGPGKLHDRARKRRAHFFALPEADPVLPQPWDQGRKYQSDAVRQKGEELIERLCENKPMVIASAPRKTPTLDTIAEKVASYFNSAFTTYQEKRGIDVPRFLASGQTIEGLAWLHWRRNNEVVPEIPDFEWTEEMPEDTQEAKRFKPKRSRRADGSLAYRETNDSRDQRHTVAKARAGWNWIVECPDMTTVAWIDDISPAPNPAIVVVVKQVGIIDYEKAIGSETYEDGRIRLSLNDKDKLVRVYMEPSAPSASDPSRFGWGDTVGVAEIWTRDEYYQLCSPTMYKDGQAMSISDWILIKSHTHPYKRCPFALVPAFEYNHPDPSLRYSPALEGMMRVKPAYDLKAALSDVLTMTTAIAGYVLVEKDTGEPRLSEGGDPIFISNDVAQTMALPPGTDLKEVRTDVSPAFVDSLKETRQEMLDAAPPTGQADVTASSQPWAIRLQQQQANVGPTNLLAKIDRGLATMFANMAMVNALPVDEGGVGEPLAVASRGEDGADNYNAMVIIQPEEWAQVDISVDTNRTSGAEQITKEAHGVDLLKEPLVKLAWERFATEYMGWNDPEERRLEFAGEQFYTGVMEGPLMKRKAQEWMGRQNFMGVNGQDLSFDGSPTTPYAIGAANGFIDPSTGRPPAPPTSNMAANGGVPGVVPPTTTMPPLQAAGSAPQGTAQVSGLPG